MSEPASLIAHDEQETVQVYDAAKFDAACERLASLLSRMQRDTADTVRRLFVDEPQVFYTVVFHRGAAFRVGTPEGVARLCLEPSECFEKLLAAVAASDLDGLTVIDHQIRSLVGMATPG